jgi:phage/conjugal plasmid C-4 type zinc finger TraR family protein
MDDNQAFNENLEEAEMAQFHSIHIHMNAINSIRASLSNRPSLSHCEECGEEIPEPRRKAVSGVRTCIDCQEVLER